VSAPAETAEGDPRETFAQAQFMPLRHLQDLQKEAQKSARAVPPRISLTSIKVVPELFQPRRMNERHVAELRRALRNGGELDPVLVYGAGRRFYLIDGHHRLQAYREEDRQEIPVEAFEGTPEEAVLAARKANSRAKLSMTNLERQNAAWQLVLLDGYSKAQIGDASGISSRQVAYMRVVKKELGHEAYSCRSWFEARRRAQGIPMEGMGQDELEEKLRRQAEDYAKRLSKEFGGQLIKKPQLAAWAFELHFDRRLEDLVWELRERLSEDDDAEEAEDE
jgi:ParB-like chromosome segregation protein Spo0J